jgi:hypothetical protein
LTKKKVSPKKSIWLTYAWEDNADSDVDFAAQELRKTGIEVKLDRWNLTAGKRLWEQIESFIQDPSKSDGWLLYATQASLGSQACKEEFAYALDRALHTRGGDFPVIALFPAPVDTDLIPAGIKTRLFVSLTDPDWKERIVAAVERQQPHIARPQVKPYALTIHEPNEQHRDHYVIEVRPRAGTWVPFFAAIPLNEKDDVFPQMVNGPSGLIPMVAMTHHLGEGPSDDGRYYVIVHGNVATPTQSYYIFCKKLPSLLIFGVKDGAAQYQVTFSSADLP